VAKGYACDRARAILDSKKDISSAIITTGSSTLLYGAKQDGSDFSAAVRNPDGSGSYLGVIKTKQCFISTSGGYERFFEADGKKYSHILDTQTGYPVETDLASVTVVCPFDGTDYCGLKSDFLSTLIYMDGTKKLDSYINTGDFFVVAADINGNIYTSKAIDFTLNEESGYRLG
jgi:thiamine biosynthesis lipoprotein